MLSKTTTYKAWANMKDRCDNPYCASYPWYGQKGITYNQAWKFFAEFFADMGECPKGFSLDRIDSKKGYSKENCRWISKGYNTRNSARVKLSFEKAREIRVLHSQGVNRHVIAKRFNIHYRTVDQVVNGSRWPE